MIVLLAVAVDAFWIEPTWLEVTEVRLSSPKLTRRVRIVVVADLQAETFGAYEREVLDRVMEAKPDLILFAGDYTQADRSVEPELRRQINAYLRHLGLSAELGVFAVEGNVDRPEWTETLRSPGGHEGRGEHVLARRLFAWPGAVDLPDSQGVLPADPQNPQSRAPSSTTLSWAMRRTLRGGDRRGLAGGRAHARRAGADAAVGPGGHQ